MAAQRFGRISAFGIGGTPRASSPRAIKRLGGIIQASSPDDAERERAVAAGRL
jgi:hypothetical protein